MRNRHRIFFPLQSDPSSRYAPYTLALLVFIATLSVVIGLILNNVLDEWKVSLSESLTIHIPPDSRLSEVKEEEKVRLLLHELKRVSGVLSVEKLSEGEVKAILQPWFSGSDTLEFVGLPTIVHIGLDRDVSPNVEGVQRVIEEIDPDAILDDRSLWQRQLFILFRGVQTLCVIVVLSMMGAIGVIVFLVGRASMINHLDVVDIMQIVGARHGLVVRVFQRRAMRLSLYGICLGMGLCILFVFAVVFFLGEDLDIAIRGDVMPSLFQWLTVLMVGLFTLLMVRYVTGRAVKSFLLEKEK